MLNNAKTSLVTILHGGTIKTYDSSITIFEGKIVKFPQEWELDYDSMVTAFVVVSRFNITAVIEVDLKTETLVIEEKFKQALLGELSIMTTEGEFNPSCKVNLLTGEITMLTPFESDDEVLSISFPLLLGDSTIMIACYQDDQMAVHIDQSCKNLQWLWSYALGIVKYKPQYYVSLSDIGDDLFCITGHLDEVKISRNRIEEIGWEVLDRAETIDNLMKWICEAKEPDKQLMIDELHQLQLWDDEFVWSNIYTNEFISTLEDPKKSDEIVEMFLQINKEKKV